MPAKLKSNRYSDKIWSNQLRTCVFFAVYQSIFNETINLETKIESYDRFLESIKTEHIDVFEEDKSDTNLDKNNILANELEDIMTEYYSENQEMTTEIKKYLSDWSKTFGIVKAILFTFILEKNSTQSNKEFENKSVGVYIKLAEEYTVLINIKLIHAILSKIQGQ